MKILFNQGDGWMVSLISMLEIWSKINNIIRVLSFKVYDNIKYILVLINKVATILNRSHLI